MDAIGAEYGDFRAYVTPLSDARFSGLSAAQILDHLPDEVSHWFIFIVDEVTLRDPENPVLVLDLSAERGRTFRVIPSEAWGVQNNLSLANMDFHEFADNVDSDGVFRGFRDG